MEPETVRAFFHWLLARVAPRVQATEAFAYEICEAEGAKRFNLLTHIRPDKADPKMRAAAQKAFLAIAEPCIHQEKDGAIQIAAPSNGKGAQFCLVALLREDPGAGKPRAMVGLVTRCLNQDEANEKLRILRG